MMRPHQQKKMIVAVDVFFICESNAVYDAKLSSFFFPPLYTYAVAYCINGCELCKTRMYSLLDVFCSFISCSNLGKVQLPFHMCKLCKEEEKKNSTKKKELCHCCNNYVCLMKKTVERLFPVIAFGSVAVAVFHIVYDKRYTCKQSRNFIRIHFFYRLIHTLHEPFYSLLKSLSTAVLKVRKVYILSFLFLKHFF